MKYYATVDKDTLKRLANQVVNTGDAKDLMSAKDTLIQPAAFWTALKYAFVNGDTLGLSKEQIAKLSSMNKELSKVVTAKSLGESMKKVMVYDNGGDSMDRYTVFIDKDVFGMSLNPLGPQGFNQHVGDTSEIEPGSHLGKKVSIASLPAEVKKAIQDRMGDHPLNEREGSGLDEMFPELDEKVKELVSDAFKEVERAYDLFGGTLENDMGVEQIEHKSRDGFISSNDGGYEGTGFASARNLIFSGHSDKLPGKAGNAIDKLSENSIEFIRDHLKERHPELVAKLPEEFFYNDIDEADLSKEEKTTLESEYQDAEDSYFEDETVMFQVRCMFEEHNNLGTFTIQGVVNWESPYHRPKGAFEDYYQSEVEFDGDIEQCVAEIKQELQKAIAYMGV